MVRCRWLGLAFALAAVATAGDDVAMTERQDTHTWAPCPPEEESAVAREEERHLTPIFSVCMLRCASQAMARMVGTQTTVSVKLNEGRRGEEHEFCWVLRLRCKAGERLTKAFVLFNPEQPPEGGQPPPYKLLLTTPPAQRQHLQARRVNRGPKLLSAEACGVRFDVTEPFRRAEGGQEAEMCVKAVCLEGDACGGLQLGLRCPPFLATLWRSLPRPDG